MMGFSS